MATLFGSVTKNSIVSRTTYNQETGGQTTTYENVNGVWNLQGMTMFSTPIGKEFTFNNHLMGAYARNVGFNNGLRNKSGNLNIRESFSVAWKPDGGMLELRPYYGFQKTTNSVHTTAGDRTVHSYGGTFSATYYTPVGIAVNSELTYSATSGYSQGYDSKQWMWNASLSYQFLKGKQATITLKAYDLLQQRTNIARSVTANYINDTMYNSLTRYFMLSFSYRFNTFGKGHEPSGAEGGFGPGGHGGPGGPGGGSGGGPGGGRRF